MYLFRHGDIAHLGCCCLGSKSCLTLCNPVDGSPPDSSVHGISQARVLECVAISFSSGSSQPRDRTCVSCLTDGFFTTDPPRKHLSRLQDSVNITFIGTGKPKKLERLTVFRYLLYCSSLEPTHIISEVCLYTWKSVWEMRAGKGEQIYYFFKWLNPEAGLQ